MAKLNLILADPDIRYLEGIKNYLGDNYSDKFNITCFTDIEIMRESLKAFKNRDILLINEELFSDKISELNINSILILSEGKVIGRTYDYPVISKFQVGPSIYKEIINAYTTQNPQNLEKVINRYDDTKLITIYSPIGGSGKSLISAALAMNLSQRGSDSLYINFEDVQSTSVYFDNTKDSSFSDLIYYIKERDDNFSAKFIELVDKDPKTAVSFFKNTDNALDIEDINKDDMRWMIESLLSLNMFKYIIIDTTSKFNSVYNLLLNSSDYIISPLLKEKTALTKVNKFIDSLTDIDKYLFLFNKSKNNSTVETPKSIVDNGKAIAFEIQEDYNLYLNEGISVLDSQIISNGILNIINTLGL